MREFYPGQLVIYHNRSNNIYRYNDYEGHIFEVLDQDDHVITLESKMSYAENKRFILSNVCSHFLDPIGSTEDDKVPALFGTKEY